MQRQLKIWGTEVIKTNSRHFQNLITIGFSLWHRCFWTLGSVTHVLLRKWVRHPNSKSCRVRQLRLRSFWRLQRLSLSSTRLRFRPDLRLFSAGSSTTQTDTFCQLYLRRANVSAALRRYMSQGELADYCVYPAFVYSDNAVQQKIKRGHVLIWSSAWAGCLHAAVCVAEICINWALSAAKCSICVYGPNDNTSPRLLYSLKPQSTAEPEFLLRLPKTYAAGREFSQPDLMAPSI